MISIAQQNFDANDLWTLGIAAYAAIISTFVLGWDAYKWLSSGAKLDVSISTGMKIINGTTQDPRTYISVTAWNIGDRPTTITNLAGVYYDSWWKAFLLKKKHSEAFIITRPSDTQRIPYRFEVGDQWVGLAEQNSEIEEKANAGYLYFVIFTAQGGRGHRVRLKMQQIHGSESELPTQS